LNQEVIRETVKSVLDSVCGLYPDVLDLITDFNGISRLKFSLAIQKIHYPVVLEDAENARRAFTLQGFFTLESDLSLSRSNIRKKNKTQKHEIQKTLLTTFKNNLKFELTKDQKKAINDIFSDMQSVHLNDDGSAYPEVSCADCVWREMDKTAIKQLKNENQVIDESGKLS
jgi:ATP-dependent DNA helicase RecG